MKDDFFKEVFDRARQTATELLNKAEETLRDVEGDLLTPDDELESLRFENDALTARVDELEDIAEDLTTAIQILMDGEVRKDVTMTWELYNNLRESDVEVIHTDDVIANKVTVTIRQER